MSAERSAVGGRALYIVRRRVAHGHVRVDAATDAELVLDALASVGRIAVRHERKLRLVRVVSKGRAVHRGGEALELPADEGGELA